MENSNNYNKLPIPRRNYPKTQRWHHHDSNYHHHNSHSYNHHDKFRETNHYHRKHPHGYHSSADNNWGEIEESSLDFNRHRSYDNKTDNKGKIYCHNCGKTGHLSKKCKYPIMSYGIILFYRYDPKDLINSDCFRTRVRQHYTLNVTEDQSLAENNSPFNEEDFQLDISQMTNTPPDKDYLQYLDLPPGLEHVDVEENILKHNNNNLQIVDSYYPKLKKTITTSEKDIDYEHQDNKDSDEDEYDINNDKKNILEPPRPFNTPKTPERIHSPSSLDSSGKLSPFPANLDELYSIPAGLENELRNLSRDSEAPSIKYLMILDRHTPDYVQIIWGNYDFDNLKYLKILISRLTQTEIKLIQTHTLTYLFVKYWIFSKKDALKLYKSQYRASKIKFELLKEGTTNKKGDHIKFENLIQEIKPNWSEPDWGFPKGRRRRYCQESDIDCAIREFREETGIDSSQYVLLRKVKPLEEVFMGSNGVTYKHVYFLAEAKNYLPIYLNPYNSLQVSEIRKIGWYSYEQGSSEQMIRSYHTEKKKLFYKIYQYLINTYYKTEKI